MNRVYPNNITIVDRGFSSFSQQATLDAKVREKDKMVLILSQAKTSFDIATRKYNELLNLKEGSQSSKVKYCTIHPNVCSAHKNSMMLAEQVYNNALISLGPKIANLNKQIKQLTALAQSEVNAALADSNLTPEERQKLEREKAALEANIALEKQKAEDLKDLQKSKNTKIIIISIAAFITLAVIVGFIYKKNKKAA
jgi:hypothetical protein